MELMGPASRLNPLAQHHAAAAPRVRDAAGKVLEIGDEVVVITPKALMRVAAITPMLAPGAPPNTMLLTLVSRVQIAVPRDTSIEDLYLLRHQAEIGDAFLGAPPAQETPEEPTDGHS